MADEQANAYYNSGHSSQGSGAALEGIAMIQKILEDTRSGFPLSMATTILMSTWTGRRSVVGTIVTAREIGGALEVSTWEEMTRIMRQRFIPSYYQRELHSKLRRLTQGSKTVEEYFQEMEVMLLRANVIEDREATMSSAGLIQETPNRLSHQNLSQRSLLQSRQGQENQFNPGPRARELKCFKCQGFGHYAYECRNKKI
ncbi:unnamed protein product [Microthlaspi erraticum]|uniref:CCHC-type domain-containing protein n=1 Tax=Microthlaspi erraticum TaxID=1685480 RepID=A0A6D2IUE5_9BRAS|nr:unnamed protein product [Microthlaspi erraticum]